MKIFHNIKKIAGSLIIVSIILLPFSDIKAQTPVNFGTSGTSGSASLSGYIKGLAPAIAEFPGCKEVFKNKIKSLFKKNIGDLSSLALKVKSAVKLKDAASKAKNAANNTLNTKDAPVKDTAAIEGIEKTEGYSESTSDSINQVNTNQNCLNAIGKAITKMLIQKMTLSIVNWIQTGNSGGPFFVQNPSKFFKDIAKNQILDFGLEINASENPFGKSFMKNIATNFNNKFQDNARYSLNEMIKNTNPKYSAQSFSQDFSQGGWGAWNAMVQVPANNPLGFNMMASNELNKRLEGTTQSMAQDVRDSLQQASGFLGDERCTNPWGLTREEDEAAKKAGVTPEEGSRLVVSGQNPTTIDPHTGMPTTIGTNQYSTLRRCKKWEYVTPGAVIGHTLTKGMDDNSNSLISTETLNDAITAIFDATMARFSNELTSGGLAYMNSDFNNYDLFDSKQIASETYQVKTDFANPSTWLQQNPTFNIRTDFNQALIDTQRTYIAKLFAESTALGDLIKWIRQLDYCIPGPNPNWEMTASRNINNLENAKMKKEWWSSAVATEIADSAGALGSIVGPIGGLVGSAVGVTFSLITDKVDKDQSEGFWARFIQGILGVNIYQKQDEILSPQALNGLLNNLLKSYSVIINDVYFNPGINMNGIDTSIYMPVSTLEARKEFEQIDGYQKMIENNAQEMVSKNLTVTRLQQKKDQLDILNNQLSSNSLNQTQYETALAPILVSFNQISSELVSGDDIADVDDMLKQIIEEKNYVKNNLLEGPAGCETELKKLWENNKLIHQTYVNREPYLLEIDHLYGSDENANQVYPGGWNEWWPIYDKSYIKPWSKDVLAIALQPVKEGGNIPDLGYRSFRQGFLFGSVYYNNHAGPWDLPSGVDSLCKKIWIHDVQLTIGSKNDNDIGGLNIEGGYNKGGDFVGDYKNDCGVVINFERNFGIY